MSTLPASLAHWAELLERLSPDLQASLSGMLVLLERLIGPMPAPARPGSGDPRGYGGVARAGPPERLLLSEWLFAEELPDEFLRRAAQNEQQHLLLERETPAEARACRVFLDTGPLQAGSPRVAQLAVLLCLQKRAIQAKASFGWSLKQDSFEADFDAAGWERLGQNKQNALPGSGDLPKTWEGCTIQERWLVGSKALLRLRHSGPVIVLEDTLEESQAVSVSLALPGSAPKTLILPLPPSKNCLALLQPPPAPIKTAAPVKAQTPRPSRPSERPRIPGVGLLWGRFTNWLAVAAPNEIRTYKLQLLSKPRIEKTGVSWLVEGDRLVAYGFVHSRMIRITVDSGGVAWLYGLAGPDKRPSYIRRWRLDGVQVEPGASPTSLVELHGQFWFVDGRSRLCMLGWEHKGHRAGQISSVGVGDGKWSCTQTEGGIWVGRRGGNLLNAVRNSSRILLIGNAPSVGNWATGIQLMEASHFLAYEGPWNDSLSLAWESNGQWQLIAGSGFISSSSHGQLLNPPHPPLLCCYDGTTPMLFSASGNQLHLTRPGGTTLWRQLSSPHRALVAGRPQWRSIPGTESRIDIPIVYLTNTGEVRLEWVTEQSPLILEEGQ
jgi:hypothetical protein